MLVAQGRGRSRLLGRGLGSFGGNFHPLVDHYLLRKFQLEGGWVLVLADLDVILRVRLVAYGGAGHPVGSGNQPGKLENPSISGSYRAPLLGQSSTPQGADRAGNGRALLVYNLTAKRLGVRKGPLSGKWDAQDNQQGQADTL